MTDVTTTYTPATIGRGDKVHLISVTTFENGDLIRGGSICAGSRGRNGIVERPGMEVTCSKCAAKLKKIEG